MSENAAGSAFYLFENLKSKISYFYITVNACWSVYHSVVNLKSPVFWKVGLASCLNMNVTSQVRRTQFKQPSNM